MAMTSEDASYHVDHVIQSVLFEQAFALGEGLFNSSCVADYQTRKKAMLEDRYVQTKIKLLAQTKEKFADCERFGHFHPDYHEALKETQAAQQGLDQFVSVRLFKAAENTLDHLFHNLVRIISDSVSENIKVLSNSEQQPGTGCRSGGKCSCKQESCG